MTWDELVALASEWPGVEQGTSYGAPALKVGGKLIACQPANAETRDGGRVAVLFNMELDERAALIEAEPELFFSNDHFRDYPAVLVRLPNAAPRAPASLPGAQLAPSRAKAARASEGRGVAPCRFLDPVRRDPPTRNVTLGLGPRAHGSARSTHG